MAVSKAGIVKQRVEVSPEMLAFIGAGALPAAAWPCDSLLLAVSGLRQGGMPLLRLGGESEGAVLTSAEIVLVVQRAACRRIFGFLPDPSTGTVWHLASQPRTAALAILDCEGSGAARETLQLARSIELLCAIFAALGAQALVPIEGSASLGERDTRRIVAARRLIDERWQEKLTLAAIARACGLNRDKLTRGFRALYGCSVAEILAENRLAGARRLLQATDLPIAEIAFRSGYLNNASFTRAFSRRFGAAPSQLRQGVIAA